MLRRSAGAGRTSCPVPPSAWAQRTTTDAGEDLPFWASGHVRRPAKVVTYTRPLPRIPIDVRGSEQVGFRRRLLDIYVIYVPRYGPTWESFLDARPLYARIDAERVFTFSVSPNAL